MQAQRNFGVLSVAGVYIGTVVGAGFASGQEVLRFFGEFGLRGSLGLGLATALFAALGRRILRLGADLEAGSHAAVIRHVAGRWLGGAIDAIITVFLFITLAVMIAGSGAVFEEQWGLPRWLGAVVMALAALATVWSGVTGVLRSISLVAPLLVVGVAAVAVATLTRQPIGPTGLAWSRPEEAASSSWPLAALLYVSYNLVLALPVLGPLGQYAGKGRGLEVGGLVGGVGLGLAAFGVYVAILAGLPEAAGFEVPMLYLARTYAPVLQLPLSLVLWGEVYTTAVANLYGLVARLGHPEGARARRTAMLLTAAAGALSGFGFSRLVAHAYPLVGYAGLAMIVALLLPRVRVVRRN